MGSIPDVANWSGRPLLHKFRRHVMQFILATVFKAVMAGPDIQLFKRFREQGSFIVKDGIRAFQDPRINDYKEWREKKLAWSTRMHATIILSLYFLTGDLHAPIRKPGAFHHAWWMAKAIYIYTQTLVVSLATKATRDRGSWSLWSSCFHCLDLLQDLHGWRLQELVMLLWITGLSWVT